MKRYNKLKENGMEGENLNGNQNKCGHSNCQETKCFLKIYLAGAEVDLEELKVWLKRESEFLSPVNLRLADSVPIVLPELKRENFKQPLLKAKITNNGWTGNLFDHHSYPRFPLEMHVVYFKAKYAFYEEAIKHDDGVVFEVHFFYIQPDDNSCLNIITDKLGLICMSGSSAKVEATNLESMFLPFTADYLMYAGRIKAESGDHKVIWIICRRPSGISHRQMIGFRTICGKDGRPLLRNVHYLYSLGKRKIYHVNTAEYLDSVTYPHSKDIGNENKQFRIRFQSLSPHQGIKLHKLKRMSSSNVKSKYLEQVQINDFAGQTEGDKSKENIQANDKTSNPNKAAPKSQTNVHQEQIVFDLVPSVSSLYASESRSINSSHEPISEDSKLKIISSSISSVSVSSDTDSYLDVGTPLRITKCYKESKELGRMPTDSSKNKKQSRAVKNKQAWNVLLKRIKKMSSSAHCFEGNRKMQFILTKHRLPGHIKRTIKPISTDSTSSSDIFRNIIKTRSKSVTFQKIKHSKRQYTKKRNKLNNDQVDVLYKKSSSESKIICVNRTKSMNHEKDMKKNVSRITKSRSNNGHSVESSSLITIEERDIGSEDFIKRNHLEQQNCDTSEVKTSESQIESLYFFIQKQSQQPEKQNRTKKTKGIFSNLFLMAKEIIYAPFDLLGDVKCNDLQKNEFDKKSSYKKKCKYYNPNILARIKKVEQFMEKNEIKAASNRKKKRMKS